MNTTKTGGKRNSSHFAGGSATGSGMNYQAVVTAIAGVHLIKGCPLDWLDGLVDDTPVAVWAETNGSGDDIRLELRDGSAVEVQAKRGLKTGGRLWNSLMSLAKALQANEIAYGVLVVSPDSSRTIAYGLSKDVRRLADDRSDNLKELAQILCSKFEEAGMEPQSICKRLRIEVVHGLDNDRASISAAKALLCSLVSEQEVVNAAWNRLYREAHAIVERRGRWEASAILGMFEADGIDISGSDSPGALLANLTRWVVDTNRNFSILGVQKSLSISQAWLPLKILACDFDREPESDAAEAMAQYHAFDETHPASADAKISDAEWIGRFYRRAVLTGGPGLGKSTLLIKVAQLYARDGFPVLKVKLSAVAARMKSGDTFEESIFQLGLDGSDVSTHAAKSAGFRNWVLLCDGLDECHDHQENVARGLQQFASGHPQARIIVTTRPIGYSTAEIADWRHYELLPPVATEGPAHLEALIRAALPTTNNLHENALDIASTELEKSASSAIISRSPQLLGMAAALLMRGGALGATKAQLYQDLFALIEGAPNLRSGGRDIPRTTLTRMLDLLGRTLIIGPLEPEAVILDRCADHLEIELGEPRLKTLEIASACLRHWEDVGLVEKVHHGSRALLTFIHKTFAEFAAARYLCDLKTPEMQRAEIANRVDDDAWAEVLNFAGGIGLADSIVSLLAAAGESGTINQLERALSIVVDPEARVSPEMQRQIVELAFNHVDGNHIDDVFSLGIALADVAKSNPGLVEQPAACRLQSPRFSTRLIAWTCGIETGEEFCELDAIPSVIHDFMEEVSQSSGPSLLGGLILVGKGKDRELLQRLALGFIRRILDEWPHDIADQYIGETFNRAPFSTFGFQLKLEALYKEIGRKYSLPVRLGNVSGQLSRMLQPDEEYDRATCTALRALCSSLVPKEELFNGVDLEQSPPVQLSAFLEIVGFSDVGVDDVWAWTEPYDSEMVREVLKALAEISPVDKSALVVDTKAMLTRIDELQEANGYKLLLSMISVDVPPPDWSAAKTLKLDQTKLKKALGHKSAWLVQAATNLLSGLGETTAEMAAELLANGQGYALGATVHLTMELDPEIATELLLSRSKGPDTPGKYYLFKALNELDPPWDKALFDAVQTGLMSLTAEVAEEAAVLALKYVESGAPVPADLLNEAFQHWTAHEKPYPQNGGVIPNSPRKTLLKGLLKLGAVEDEALMNLCRDTRGDVRETAAGPFLERIGVSDGIRASFVNEVKTLPARLLSRALDAQVPFSVTEVDQLCILLEDEDAKWRLASSELLRPIYLEAKMLKSLGEKLSYDSHQEVRQSAARVLDKAKTF